MATKQEKKSKAATAAPPVPKKITVPDVEALAERIRDALRAQMTYSESLEIAITLAAGTYQTYLKCIASMNKRAKVMYPILTREGSKAYKIYPDVEHLPAMQRALKDSLKSLGLTLDTLTATDDDPYDTLTDKVNDLR